MSSKYSYIFYNIMGHGRWDSVSWIEIAVMKKNVKTVKDFFVEVDGNITVVYREPQAN